MRLALYGPQGAGKSTSSSILRSVLGRGIEIVHSARPLYDLQERIYAYAAIEKDPALQDGEMLRTLAAQLRRVKSSALADLVVTAADRAGLSGNVDLFLCDDSVLSDRQVLAAGGFKFVYIAAPEDARLERRRLRGDIGEIGGGNTPSIPDDYTILNDGSLEELEARLRALLSEIL